MLKKIEDIKKALEAKAYLSALALTLTLPDICGKIAYPNDKNGERYIKWFNENLTKYDYPKEFDEKLKFDGKKCWKLRCAFLHEGSINGIPDIDKFELSISKSFNGLYGASKYSINGNEENPSYAIRLDIAQICFRIYSCAEAFYDKHEDKSVFEDQNITIIDIDAEANKIQRNE
ncbi:hypothetical protein MTZ49_07305 [Entomomonas sp. E2T0]|uniref:hypothetical protein n=1 Tax=Entomomonas sp. E2T0 TaxID=2930213 RepID=UPI0022282713|nr:hypothetical protein [Entomomonas sp. E2T0]UYZ85346.1 hypothetical protein MTZ49_07305 [Entomomonas sp. E2T0]